MDLILIISIAAAVIFLIISLSIATFADSQLKSFYDEMFNEIGSLRKTSADFAHLVNNYFFNNRLNISKENNIFGGYFSPAKRGITLSDEVYNSGSISALTITAHELGHALQFRDNPELLVKNYKFSRAVKILGGFLFPLIAATILLFLFSGLVAGILGCVAILLFFILALSLKISSTKIEKDASKKALMLLDYFKALDEDEIKNAKKLLDYAALTYTADFFRALLFWTMLTRKTKIFN